MTARPAFTPEMPRRRFLSTLAAGAAAAALPGCINVPREPERRDAVVGGMPYYERIYGPMVDEGHAIPAIPFQEIDPRYYRQEVRNTTGEGPGTIVVDTGNHFLYYTMRGGRAMRYGVGLGRAGFEWSGKGVIEWKQSWPRWFPPDEMIDREPELEKYRAKQIRGENEWEGGMEGGISNPLGARALYIFQDGKDTLYRVHGSPEWRSIGKSVSSGCVRLMNQDIIDLYARVNEGSPIVVTSGVPSV